MYTATANYRYHIDNLGGSAFGVYAIAGGGWYYRHSQISKDFVVPAGTVCAPVWYWWGYACEAGHVPADNVLASKGSSAGGVNAGASLTLRLGDQG